MKEKHFYIIKDSFFEKVNDVYIKGNKKAKKVMKMRLKGVKFFDTQVDVIKILDMIKNGNI